MGRREILKELDVGVANYAKLLMRAAEIQIQNN